MEPVSYFRLANELANKSSTSGSWQQRCSSRSSQSTNNSLRHRGGIIGVDGEEAEEEREELEQEIDAEAPALVRVRSWYVNKPERVSQ